MLTRAGTATLIGSAVLLVAGRLFGLFELTVLAAIGLALVGAAWVTVRVGRPRLTVERRVHPERVHAGTPSRVELAVQSHGRRRSPVVTLHDGVSGTRGARLQVAPLRSGDSVVAAYRLPTETRGVVRVGPLEVVRTDPFGLARATVPAGSATDLTVLPRVEPFEPLPLSVGNDPLAGSEHPNDLGRLGDEFYALRAYVVGDDLRRVHWPSTARTGDLLVRQDEQPWQGRLTVLLDVRHTTTDHDTFERMVVAAASIATAARRRGDLVRLVTNGGIDTGFASGQAQFDMLMEELAVVALRPAPPVDATVRQPELASGALVAVVGDLTRTDLASVLRSRSGASTTVVRFGAGHPGAAPAQQHRPGAQARIVDVPPGRTGADEWNRAVARR